jgi:hypothetical protein
MAKRKQGCIGRFFPAYGRLFDGGLLGRMALYDEP